MMRSYLLSELAQACGAELVGSDQTISAITTDSRQAGEGSLFVTLKGERFDAHQFVPQVAEAGGAAALVSQQQDAPIAQLVVDDRLKALGDLGRFNRDQFDGKVVAVTGSAGKTTVKEMLASMLASRARTLATKGNLNNEIGAPLTLLELAPEHKYAVIELGASGIGEIARTVAMTQPHVAILNNAMEAHVEGFGSLENIIQAKSEIYEGLQDGGIGIVNLDDPASHVWSAKLAKLQRRVITFGTHAAADVRAEALVQRGNGCFNFRLRVRGESYPVFLNVMGRHMVLNALAAIAAWVALELPLERAVRALSEYCGFKGRMQSHQLTPKLQLIDDSYNANPGSMRAAVDVLGSLAGPHTLVLGAMAELGESERQLHRELGEYIGKAGIKTLIATGELMRDTVEAAAAAGVEAHFYANHEEIMTFLSTVSEGAILVKGSRSAAMDKVVAALIEGNA